MLAPVRLFAVTITLAALGLADCKASPGEQGLDFTLAVPSPLVIPAGRPSGGSVTEQDYASSNGAVSASSGSVMLTVAKMPSYAAVGEAYHYSAFFKGPDGQWAYGGDFDVSSMGDGSLGLNYSTSGQSDLPFPPLQMLAAEVTVIADGTATPPAPGPYVVLYGEAPPQDAGAGDGGSDGGADGGADAGP